MELAIETIGLTKRFGSLIAVNKLDLKVERNAIHGFLGPNGAGKTTTIKILMGLLRPNEGMVKVFGQEVQRALGCALATCQSCQDFRST